MKAVSLFLVVQLFIYSVKAQDFFKVKAGEEPKKAIPATLQYLHPQFQTGKVVFLNGTTSVAQLNYNLLLSEIHFINNNKDTLSLANEQLIKEIFVGSQQFIFDAKYGYLLIEPAPESLIRLGTKQELRVTNVERVGGYQQSLGATSTKSYSSFSNGNASVQKLDLKGDVVFRKYGIHFFIDQNNRCYKTTKSSLHKIFPKYKKQIDSYLQENTIDFQNEKDLNDIIQFCRQFT